MAPSWGDPRVTEALSDVVARLGRRALTDPALIQAELTAELGGNGSFRPQVDALVVAVEENVPEGMLASVPALDLGDWLDERGMPPPAAGWVLTSWGRVLAEQRRRADGWADDEPRDEPVASEPAQPAQPAQPPVAPVAPEPPAGPEPEPKAEPEPEPKPKAETEPVPDPEPPAPSRHRRGRLIGAAAGLVVVLAIAVAAVAAFSSGGDGRASRTGAAPGSAVPGSGAPSGVALKPSKPGALTGGIVVLARAGGSERFPAGTSPAFLDAAAAQAKGLRAAPTGDLRWTSDDVPVLVEGARIAPPMYCAKRYTVARTTWSSLLSSCLTQASASPDGRSYPVAGLASVLQRLSAVARAQLFLQIRTPLTGRQRQTLLMQLDQTNMTGRVVISSFNASDLAPFRATGTTPAASPRLMLFTRTASPDGAAARRSGYWAVAAQSTAVSSAYVQDMHAFGVRVVAWNVDDSAGWAAAGSAGVDAVVSDTPRAYLSWAATR